MFTHCLACTTGQIPAPQVRNGILDDSPPSSMTQHQLSQLSVHRAANPTRSVSLGARAICVPSSHSQTSYLHGEGSVTYRCCNNRTTARAYGRDLPTAQPPARSLQCAADSTGAHRRSTSPTGGRGVRARLRQLLRHTHAYECLRMPTNAYECMVIVSKSRTPATRSTNGSPSVRWSTCSM